MRIVEFKIARDENTDTSLSALLTTNLTTFLIIGARRCLKQEVGFTKERNPQISSVFPVRQPCEDRLLCSKDWRNNDVQDAHPHRSTEAKDSFPLVCPPVRTENARVLGSRELDIAMVAGCEYPERKIYLQRPLRVRGDGPLEKMRRRYRQFYPGYRSNDLAEGNSNDVRLP